MLKNEKAVTTKVVTAFIISKNKNHRKSDGFHFMAGE